jgi:hypothetical protein
MKLRGINIYKRKIILLKKIVKSSELPSHILDSLVYSRHNARVSVVGVIVTFFLYSLGFLLTVLTRCIIWTR